MATITFAGALLALAFGLGDQAGDARLSGLSGFMLDGAFSTGIVLLLLTVLVAVRGITPGPRHLLNPELLRHYVLAGRPEGDLLDDAYKTEVVLLTQLGSGNRKRAEALVACQRLLASALVVTAAGALILFFCT